MAAVLAESMAQRRLSSPEPLWIVWSRFGAYVVGSLAGLGMTSLLFPAVLSAGTSTPAMALVALVSGAMGSVGARLMHGLVCASIGRVRR